MYWNRRYGDTAMPTTRSPRPCPRPGSQRKLQRQALLASPGSRDQDAADPFKVFTAFWRALPSPGDRRPCPPRDARRPSRRQQPTPADWKLLPTHPDWAGGLPRPGRPARPAHHALCAFSRRSSRGYDKSRDLPDREGTSRLSPHLRFGEISPRQVWQRSPRHADRPQRGDREIPQRDSAGASSAYHLLAHEPDLRQDELRKALRRVPAGAKPAELLSLAARPDRLSHRRRRHARNSGRPAGCTTGCAWSSARFLVKHLLIDWREGEAWFWDTLVDADSASNPANWQWVAGSGADAAPYFRIFNPVLQGEKFDPEGAYRPALGAGTRPNCPTSTSTNRGRRRKTILAAAGVALGETYPHPIVDHRAARERALAAYGASR